MKDNYKNMRQRFIQEDLLYKSKSKSFSFLETQVIYELWKLGHFGKKTFEIQSAKNFLKRFKECFKKMAF